MTVYALGLLVRTTLIEPEEKVFQRSVETLIRRNSEALNDATKAFIYDGVIYKLSTMKGITRGAPPLDTGLIKDMDTNRAILHSCKREVQTIWQALLPLVETYEPCNALPDQLQAVMEKKYPPRTISFEDMLLKESDTINKNWVAAEPLLNYFISLRLVI